VRIFNIISIDRSTKLDIVIVYIKDMPNFAVGNNIQRIAPQKIITEKNQTNQQDCQPQKHAIVTQMPQRKQKEKNSYQPSQIPNIQIFTFSAGYYKQHFIIWEKFAKLIHIHQKK
jgi:hypothetical protein